MAHEDRLSGQVPMRQEDVLGRLREACRQAGSQKHWAELNGVSGAYVSDVLHRRREPGDSILRGLGLQRTVSFVARESV